MVGDSIALRFIEKHPDDVARLLELAEANEIQAFMAALSPQQAAPVINHFGLYTACCYLAGLPPEPAVEIIKTLPVQHAAALLRGMPLPARSAILAAEEISPRIKTILRFPKGVVGAVMDTDPVTAPAGFTVKEARKFLKKYQDKISDPLFVTGSDQLFSGTIDLKDLLCADNAAGIVSLCKPAIHGLSPRESLELVSDYPAWQQVSVMPVIGQGGRLLGVLSRDRLQETLDVLPESSAQTAEFTDVVLSLGGLFWDACSSMLADTGDAQQHIGPQDDRNS